MEVRSHPYTVEKTAKKAIPVTGRCNKCGFSQTTSEEVGYKTSYKPDGDPNPSNELSAGNAIGRSISLGYQFLREMHNRTGCDGLLSLSNPLY